MADKSTIHLNTSSDDPDEMIPEANTVRLDTNATPVTDKGTVRLPQQPTPGVAFPSGTIRLQPDQATGENFNSFRQNQILGTVYDLKNGQYTVVKIISEGKTGEANIYLVENQQKETFILKKYKHDIPVKQEVLNTVKNIDHPHVIHLFDYGTLDGSFYELMEYAEGGVVSDRAPIRDPEDLRTIISQTASALDHCHKKQMVHRDIKPDNLFLKDKKGIHILIADFGISSLVDAVAERKVTTQALTFDYAAPELLILSGANDNRTIIGPPVDYYSLGLTLMSLWMGHTWCDGMSPFETSQMIARGYVEPPNDMPEDIAHAVRGLLVRDEAERWGYDEIQRWLNGENVPVATVSVQQENELKPFEFIKDRGEILTAKTPDEMANLIYRFREQGIKHLYRNNIAEWIRPLSGILATELEDTLEIYPKEKRLENYGILKAFYLLSSQKTFLDRKWQLHSLKDCKGIDDAMDIIGNTIEDQNSAEEYLRSDDLKLFFTAFDQSAEYQQIKKNIIESYENKTFSAQKAANKLILFLQKGDTLRINGKDFRSFSELTAAPVETQKMLAKEIHKTDSKFLCWLEEMYLKRDSRDISESNVTELLELIKQMPWLKKYDEELCTRLNQQDEEGYTDLMKMAKFGELDACKELVENGAEVSYRDTKGHTAFSVAALAQQIDVMDYLLSCGTDKNPENADDEPLIHELAREDCKQSLSFLIQKGVDADCRRKKDDWTPLMEAVSARAKRATHILLKAGADPNALDDKQVAPLHMALDDNDPEFMTMLLNNGAKVDIGISDFKPIHLAARESKNKALQLLLEKGADPDAGKAVNNTPLQVAAGAGNTEGVDILLKAGADISAGVHIYPRKYSEDEIKEKNLWAPALYNAIHAKKWDTARFLIEAGAPLKFNDGGMDYLNMLRNKYKDNPDEVYKTIELMLQKGADPNFGVRYTRESKNSQYAPALGYAFWDNQQKLVKLFLKYHADPNISYNNWTLLHSAVYDNQTEMVNLLLEHGAYQDARSDDKQTALMIAVYQKEPNLEIIDALLKNGASPYINDGRKGNLPVNPFCYAAKFLGPEVIKIFLKYDADPTKAISNDEEKSGPLTFAIRGAQNENLKLLTQKRKWLKEKDKDGYTPLMTAAVCDNPTAASLLIKKGAKVLQKSKKGENAIEIALCAGNWQVAKKMVRQSHLSSIPSALAAFPFKIIAIILMLDTFLWTLCNSFFVSSKFLQMLAGYNVLFCTMAETILLIWLLILLPFEGFEKVKHKPVLTTILSGVLGIVIFVLHFGGAFSAFEDFFVGAHTGLAQIIIPFLTKIPFLKTLKLELQILIVLLILLTVFFAIARLLSNRARKIRRLKRRAR